jgi:hypothetical protein
MNTILFWGVFITAIWWLGHLHRKQNLKVPGIFERVMGFVFSLMLGMIIVVMPALCLASTSNKIDLITRVLPNEAVFNSPFGLIILFLWIFINLLGWYIYTQKWQLGLKNIYLPVLVLLFSAALWLSIKTSLDQLSYFQFSRNSPENMMRNIHVGLDKYHQKYHRFPETIKELTQKGLVNQQQLIAKTKVISDSMEKYHYKQTLYSGVNYIQLPEDASDCMVQAWLYWPNDLGKGLVLFKSGESVWLDQNDLLLALADTSCRLETVKKSASMPETKRE